MTRTSGVSGRARAAVLAMGLVAASAGAALAHHGWAWAEDEFTELEGSVVSVYVGNPHAAMELDVDGQVWDVELAPPQRSINAGFTEDAVSEGDTVTVVGHRSRDPEEFSLKAVRVVIDGQNVDVYPNMVPAD